MDNDNISQSGQFFSEVATTLINSGVDVNAKNEDGNTALHFAAEKLNFNLIKTLVKNGADETLRNKKNETALQFAQRTVGKELRSANRSGDILVGMRRTKLKFEEAVADGKSERNLQVQTNNANNASVSSAKAQSKRSSYSERSRKYDRNTWLKRLEDKKIERLFCSTCCYYC